MSNSAMFDLLSETESDCELIESLLIVIGMAVTNQNEANDAAISNACLIARDMVKGIDCRVQVLIKEGAYNCAEGGAA